MDEPQVRDLEAMNERQVQHSFSLKNSSKASRRTRQCLPTLRHGRFPSRHQSHTVDSLTPRSLARSSAPRRSLPRLFSSGTVKTAPFPISDALYRTKRYIFDILAAPFCVIQCVLSAF